MLAMEGNKGLFTNNGCDCYVDGDEVRAAVQQDFPKQCLQNCRAQFLRSTLPEWTDEGDWETGCKLLTGDKEKESFWSLYWCDMQFCGVAISQTGGFQQDPNVGLIINTCQNIGFHSVMDPGPPSTAYACQTAKEEEALCTLTRIQNPGVTGAVSVAQQFPTSLSSAPADGLTADRVAPTTTQPEPTTTSAATSSPIPSSAIPTTTHTLPGSDKNGDSNSTTSGSPLSGEAKIAIGVCSALALVALIALALLYLYRRNRRKTSPHRSLRTHLRLTQHVPPSSSPTPLISATNSATSGGGPLTPPLRLRDRRFLPSILRPGNRSPSPPLTPLTPAYNPYHHLHPGSNGGVFPSSPICSPTTNKLIPRHERAPRVHAGSTDSATTANLSLPPVALAMPPPGTATSRGSLSSYGGASASSITGHSSLRNEISQMQMQVQSTHQFSPSPAGTATPPSSPTRPSRPHDAPLEIPDLVTPASPMASPLGPPPNRALPPPPPPPPPLGGGGNTASFTAVGGRGFVPKGVQVLREGGEGEYDPRGSWGSWSGTASGVVGGKEAV